jgi:hypothetical protein
MKRKLGRRVLPVLVGVLATGLLAAAGAQASPEFHVESAPATIEGSQTTTQELKVTTGVVKCTTVTTKGTLASTTSTELEVEPTYGGCKAFGVNATWAANGCKYKSTMVIGSNPPTTVTDVVCPAGKEMTITPTGINCVIHIPPQNNIKHVVWDKEGSGATRDLKATLTEEGITYSETGAGCFFPGTYNTGVYFGTETVKARKAESVQQGIWAE